MSHDRQLIVIEGFVKNTIKHPRIAHSTMRRCVMFLRSWSNGVKRKLSAYYDLLQQRIAV